MRRRRLLLGLILVAAISAPAALAQTSSTTPQPGPTSSAVPSPTPTTAPLADALTDLQDELANLRTAQDRLKNQQDNQRDLMFFVFGPVAILVGLLTAGGTVGIITSLRAEQRTSQLHALAVAGETAGQARQEQVHASFLDASQKTLGLVNDTLQLAKDASERAVATMTDKAQRRLDALDRRALELVREALLRGDMKALVSEANSTNAILEIATELQAIEGFLSLQDIELTSAALFVRGMERHLHQEPHAAVSNLWQSLENTPEEGLEDLALYWIGYEYNNLGQHEQAANTFKRAVARAGRSQRRTTTAFELQRIELESRFFHEASSYSDAGSDEQRLRAAVSRVEGLDVECLALDAELANHQGPGFVALRSDLLNTLGNIRTWQAVALQALAPKEALMKRAEAVDAYETAVKLGESAPPLPWYRLFGLLEALTYHPASPNPYSAQYTKVEDGVQRQIPSRYEPRSLVLLQQTRLICIYRQGGTVEQLSAAMSDIQKELRSVKPEVTIYSQLKKCNVKRSEFESEIQARYQEFRAATQAGARRRRPR